MQAFPVFSPGSKPSIKSWIEILHPAPPRRRFTTSSIFCCFGAVAAFVFYATYRVNDVLVYQWNWERVLGFLFKYDEETQSWVSNLFDCRGWQLPCGSPCGQPFLPPIVGVVMGYWRTCENLALRIISRCYVELIRNIPPIVFIFIFLLLRVQPDIPGDRHRFDIDTQLVISHKAACSISCSVTRTCFLQLSSPA